MYGGRDTKAYVPVQQSFSWDHGIIATVHRWNRNHVCNHRQEGVPEIKHDEHPGLHLDSYGQERQNNLDFGRKLKKQPIVSASTTSSKKFANGKYVNSPQDKHVWIKMDGAARSRRTGSLKDTHRYIPKYEDLKKLFKSGAGQNYTTDDYIKQFTIRVPENLSRLNGYRDSTRKTSLTHRWRCSEYYTCRENVYL